MARRLQLRTPSAAILRAAGGDIEVEDLRRHADQRDLEEFEVAGAGERPGNFSRGVSPRASRCGA